MKQCCESLRAVHSSREPVEDKLQRIAMKARQEPKTQFTSVYHLLGEELLRGCFKRLRGDAACGIDEVTKKEYSQNLDERLRELSVRLQDMKYVPQAVKRVYIPKVGSKKMRPLGIPVLEDKLVQMGIVKILEAIYEQDFVADSYGFRPRRGCHDALRALSRSVENEKVNYIVEADIKGFFDNVKHEWLMKFLEHRIKDSRMLRMIKRFLRAKILEDGVERESEQGTPQGGVISPLLANIYLHYVLDLWFGRRYIKTCRGYARQIRYADDFVACFQNKAEAERYRQELIKRLKEFVLEVEASKTKILAFGRFAAENAKPKKPETFDFLGFTHYCSKTRDGKRFRMKRVTERKKFTAKVKEFKEWLKSARTQKTKEIMEKARQKLQGHIAYYGVTDNSAGVGHFVYVAERLLHKWLNRRGKRSSISWELCKQLMERYRLPKPRIMVSLF
jgi:RNA-directed DNA polymerase